MGSWVVMWGDVGVEGVGFLGIVRACLLGGWNFDFFVLFYLRPISSALTWWGYMKGGYIG